MQGVRGEGAQVHRREVERALLVQPGEHQQVLDQGAHPDRLVLDPAHGAPDVGLGGQGAHPVQLGEAADPGQRGAQLVRGVGDEPPHPALGLRPGGEGGLDLRQHAVEGDGEPADLGVRREGRHPVRELAGGDQLGALLDPAQRPQSGADGEEAERRDHQQDDAADRQEGGAQPVDGGVDVLAGDGDHHVGGAGRGRGEDAGRGARPLDRQDDRPPAGPSAPVGQVDGGVGADRGRVEAVQLRRRVVLRHRLAHHELHLAVDTQVLDQVLARQCGQ